MGGGSSTYDYGFRIYNPSLGKFLSVDPLSKSYPWYTPYQFAGNTPIQAIDLDGAEPVYVCMNNYVTTSQPELTAPSQWYVYVNTITYSTLVGCYSTVVTNVDVGTFCSAAQYNALHGNYNLYTSISQRNMFYAFADNRISKRSRWFGAAEIVTRDNAVGAAESINLTVLSRQTEDFLSKGNEFLFKYNMDNYREIQGEGITKSFTDANGIKIDMCGLGGKSLDYALVQYEQTKVQEYIESYKKDNPDADMSAVMQEVNDSMYLSAAPSEVAEVMQQYFNEDLGQEKFDFSKYENRILLGQKLVDKLYDKTKK
jgi:hypothetical protein